MRAPLPPHISDGDGPQIVEGKLGYFGQRRAVAFIPPMKQRGDLSR
jgi:hypothetical protein